MRSQGVVVKAYGGFYYVRMEEKVWECVLRGLFRAGQQQVLVGDNVEFKKKDDRSGIIETILPRHTVLMRPRVANVEKAIIVFATRDPRPNPLLLDRFLVQAIDAAIKPFICFNKIDLGAGEAEELIQIYKKAGYEVLVTSAKEKNGIEQLGKIVREGISILAGPSGAGKSSLLNALSPGLSLKTGEVSFKAGRGKHTTRHVELLFLVEGGLVVDTPGFSRLSLPAIRREELAYFFPEFSVCVSCGCQFTSCLHFQEPGCAIKRAVETEKISATRYHNYIRLLKEVIERERRYKGWLK